MGLSDLKLEYMRMHKSILDAARDERRFRWLANSRWQTVRATRELLRPRAGLIVGPVATRLPIVEMNRV